MNQRLKRGVAVEKAVQRQAEEARRQDEARFDRQGIRERLLARRLSRPASAS